LVSFVTQPEGEITVRAGWADPLIRPDTDFKLLYYGPNNIYLNQNYLPRVWVVHRVSEISVGDTSAVISRLESPQFNPALEAVIEGNLSQPLGQSIANDHLTLVSYKNAEAVIQLQLAQAGLVVFSDIYYPGWKAYVDDQEQPIYPTNLAMRGVWVAPGQHTLRFIYEPFSLKIGGGISLTGCGLILIGLAVQFFRQTPKIPQK
jgi:hypothetical protein